MAANTKTKLTTKVRQTSNSDQLSPLPINERILKECHNMYTDPVQGLITISKEFDVTLLPPRKKITVLLLGNHSAGKSSFINWYIEEHIQKTGVAIETQGFALVTSGKRRESLTGNATLQLYPYLKPLGVIPGVLDFLTTEISSSKQKKFGLVTFIDTPGLVDGDMKYPFDVNKALHWMGDLADLIFVFFDPIGQAFCKRTLDIVEKLNIYYANKVRLYLSKIDEVVDEADRQKVMMQIVQELCKRQGLNRTGFDMPCIFVPASDLKPNRCGNQIEAVCREIEHTINHTVQSTLNSLEKDAENATKLLDLNITKDDQIRAENNQTTKRAFIFGFIPFILFFNFLLSMIGRRAVMQLIGHHAASILFLLLAPFENIWSAVPEGLRWRTMFIIIMVSSVMYVYKSWTFKPTLSHKQRMRYIALRDHINSQIKPKKEMLYKEYLEQCVGDHDL